MIVDLAALLAAVQTHDDRGAGFRVSHVDSHVVPGSVEIRRAGFRVGSREGRRGDLQLTDVHILTANRSLEGTQSLGNQNVDRHGR